METTAQNCFVERDFGVELFTNKVGSRERGNAWSLNAENLNKSEYEFKVSMRSVGETLGKLNEDWLCTEREERRASGIENTADDEFDQAMRDIHERLEEVKEEWNKESKKAEEEKNKAEYIRKIATERNGQTKKRLMSDLDSDDDDDNDEELPGRKRRACQPRKSDFGKLFSDSLKMKIEERKGEKEQEHLFQQNLLQQQQAFFSQQRSQMMQFMKESYQQQQLMQQQQLTALINILKK